jgi:hypothetical protein
LLDQMRAHRVLRVVGHGNRYVARARTRRAERTQHGRARKLARAGHHERGTGRTLVGGLAPFGQEPRELVHRQDLEERLRQRGDFGPETDVGNVKRAGVRSRRFQ